MSEFKIRGNQFKYGNGSTSFNISSMNASHLTVSGRAM
jgi:hypothetical protein